MKNRELTVICTHEETARTPEEIIRASFLAFIEREQTVTAEGRA